MDMVTLMIQLPSFVPSQHVATYPSTALGGHSAAQAPHSMQGAALLRFSEMGMGQNTPKYHVWRMNVDEPSEKWVDNIPNIYLIILVWTLSVLFEMIAVYLLNLSHFFVLFLLFIHLSSYFFLVDFI